MKRWWIVALIVALAAGGLYVAARRRGSSQGEMPRWRTATVARGNLEVTVSASGSIQPAAQVEVRSRATGVVQAVLVVEGERVTQGQELVQIDDPDAAAAVRNAQAALAGATARLRRVEAQRRALTAQDAAQIRQAQASLEAAQARPLSRWRSAPTSATSNSSATGSSPSSRSTNPGPSSTRRGRTTAAPSSICSW